MINLTRGVDNRGTGARVGTRDKSDQLSDGWQARGIRKGIPKGVREMPYHFERPNHLAIYGGIAYGSAFCKECEQALVWNSKLGIWDHAIISEFPIPAAEIAIKVNRARAGMHGTAFWSIKAIVTYPAGFLTVERMVNHIYPIKGTELGAVPNGYTMAEALAAHSAMLCDLIEYRRNSDAN